MVGIPDQDLVFFISLMHFILHFQFIDCSKKYKHANGLKYHQSHAHGAGSMDEDSQQLPESPRDSQQLPDSPPPIQSKHATPLPSTRAPLSSFESIASSGESIRTFRKFKTKKQKTIERKILNLIISVKCRFW